MAQLSDYVKDDLFAFICDNIEDWRHDAQEYGGMDLTIACNDEGTRWNYQTGDNSYTGGAYGLPHWAVTTIAEDSDAICVLAEVIDQLEDLLAYQHQS